MNLGPHALLSGDKPRFTPRVSGDNDSMLAALLAMGEDAIETRGHYGVPERSIMVRSPKDVEGIKTLARDYGQESVLFSDGLNHQMTYLQGRWNGGVNPGSGTVFHESEPEDFYTVLPDGTIFTHTIEFAVFSFPNKQEIFNTVALHLMKQGRPSAIVNSLTDTRKCVYRDGQGGSCAVGCLLTDEEADAIAQAGGNSDDVDSLLSSGLLPERFKTEIDLLIDLQGAHDMADQNNFWPECREALVALAKEKGLQVPEEVKRC